ncbi:palmitoyltransferase ERF2 [Candida albicans P78048]|uniref:Palmitoyltransferase n=1 Tax=Candida albicans P78048 TaxID=1094989 RepID=A0AB34Q293_CANAX|nr:palmitoyltransferase ERF2 [Candida albicans P78048]
MVSPSSPESNDDDDLTNADSAITPATSTITTDSPTKSSFDDYQSLSSIRIPITRRITPSLSPQYEESNISTTTSATTTTTQQQHQQQQQQQQQQQLRQMSSLSASKIEQAKTDVLNNKKISFIHRFITNWLIMDPNLISHYNNTNTRRFKNYQIENQGQSNFIYFLGGRLHTIKTKYPINLITLSLIIIPGILYIIFELSWQWRNFSPIIVIIFLYIWIISIFHFFKLSTCDAGKLPKNIHLPKKLITITTTTTTTTTNDNEIDHRNNYKVTGSPPDEYFNTVTLPYWKTNNDNNDNTKISKLANAYHSHGVQVKYCGTCHIWRPSRTSHCNTCQQCILNHDHHCIFLNNCIGQRNYKFFLWFLLYIVIACLYLLIISILQLCHYKFASHKESEIITTFNQSIKTHPISLLLLIYSCLAICYPGLLLAFHIFLTSQNITTREYLNFVYKKPSKSTDGGDGTRGFVNVYNTHSIWENLYINWLGKSNGVSLTFPRDYYHQGDIRFANIEPLGTFTNK